MKKHPISELSTSVIIWEDVVKKREIGLDLARRELNKAKRNLRHFLMFGPKEAKVVVQKKLPTARIRSNRMKKVWASRGEIEKQEWKQKQYLGRLRAQAEREELDRISAKKTIEENSKVYVGAI